MVQAFKMFKNVKSLPQSRIHMAKTQPSLAKGELNSQCTVLAPSWLIDYHTQNGVENQSAWQDPVLLENQTMRMNPYMFPVGSESWCSYYPAW